MSKQKIDNPINDILLELKDLDFFDDEIDSKFEGQVLRDLAGVDGFHEYLKQLISQDMKKHFQSSPGGQLLIRGGINRLMTLRRKIIKESDTPKKKVTLKSKRHI